MGTAPQTEALKRCSWCLTHDLYIDYHDNEWGEPVHDERRLFEFLILEGMQAGLSWLTVLKKRDAFRQAFSDFDPEKMACFNDKKVTLLLQNTKIIRNKLKINAAISNAQVFLNLKEQGICFSDYLWQFTEGKVITHHYRQLEQVPAETPGSRAMSKTLKRQGFSFVGPTICYAFMQAVGMVNDHLVTCFRHQALKRG